MGFCYEGRKLVCDNCSTAGARKHKCPFGYCSSCALCKECVKTVKASGKWKEIHKNCKANHEAFAAKEAEKVAIVEAGGFLRVAAMGTKDGKVRVLFRGKTGDVGYTVEKTTYDAFPLGANVTPEDFAKVGELTPAPATFDDLWTAA